MATRIGCDHLMYAIMTKEDTATAAPTFGTPKAAPGVMHININPNASQETLFADDGPMETATTLGKIEVEIQKNELTTENRADLLGHVVDANGAVVYSDSDIPPYVAIAFRTLKSNGKYRYTWLYKGKFMDPEEENETKGDGINFQADTISGQFTRLNNEVTIGAKKKRIWKYELDEEYEKAKSETITSWFESVVMPAATEVEALSAKEDAGTPAVQVAKAETK